MTLMMDQLIEIKWIEKKLKKKLFFSRFKFQFISKLMAIFPILRRKKFRVFFSLFSFFFIIQTLCVWVFGDFYLISKECVVTRTKKKFLFFSRKKFLDFFSGFFFVTDNTHTPTHYYHQHRCIIILE